VKIVADPIAWLWFGLVAGALVLFFRRRPKWAGLLLGIALATNAIEVFKVPARLLANLERPYLRSSLPPLSVSSPADAVVVLGGGFQAFTNSYIPIKLGESGDRLLTGIALVREGKGRVLVLGGGGRKKGDGRKEIGERRGRPEIAAKERTERIEADMELEPIDAEAGKKWVEDWKLVPNQVEILGACKNTRDEALHTEAMAREKGWKKILLVTSAWHMRRALPTFRNTGLEVIPVGCDASGTAALQNHDRVTFIPGTGTLETFELWFTETLGYAWYRLRGWTPDKR
jgi:uncharacterized SAM-binding protein YcdF (DUF218 family)